MTGNNNGAAGMVGLSVMYLGTVAPSDWVINEGKPDERRGTTYRINIMTLDTNQVGTIKVSEELWRSFGDNAIVPTDKGTLVMTSKFQLKAVGGRATNDLTFTPDHFIPAAEAAD